MPKFHPSEDMLLEYAAGSLSEPAAVLVATHLALCPECREQVFDYERIGGTLLDDLDPVSMRDGAFERTMAALEGGAPIEIATNGGRAGTGSGPAGDLRLPQPLRACVGGEIEAVGWRSRGRGIREHELAVPGDGFRTKLLRIAPGETVPRHTHDGNEITLVLTGGFTDGTGHYERGDVAFATGEVDHAPQADPDEECLCLAVTDGALRLTGPIGRMLNLFIRV